MIPKMPAADLIRGGTGFRDKDHAPAKVTTMAAPRRIGMLIFPRLTQLDMTGPYEVLARLPNTAVDLVARTRDPVTTDHVTVNTTGSNGIVLAPFKCRFYCVFVP